jgi:hypothetical protein
MADLNSMKREVFFGFLELVGRAYILVRYSEDASVGRRGFLPEEKENGMVLVLNSRMDFVWDESGVSATLAFGSTREKCHIPAEDIVAVYSPELGAQFVVSAGPHEEARADSSGRTEEKTGAEDNVIKVDFKKRR